MVNHHKLVSSTIVFARHCWPLGLFIYTRFALRWRKHVVDLSLTKNVQSLNGNSVKYGKWCISIFFHKNVCVFFHCVCFFFFLPCLFAFPLTFLPFSISGSISFIKMFVYIAIGILWLWMQMALRFNSYRTNWVSVLKHSFWLIKCVRTIKGHVCTL